MPEQHQSTNTVRLVNAVHRRLSEAHAESFEEAVSWLSAKFSISQDLARACVEKAVRRGQYQPRRVPSRRCLHGPRSDSSPLWENNIRAWEDRDEGFELSEVYRDKEKP